MIPALAFDASLTDFGWCASPTLTGRIRVKSRDTERLADIRHALEGLIYQHAPRVVAIEGYAYGASQKAHQIGELGGMVRLLLHDHGIPLVVVQPTSIKKYATGKGNAQKDDMVATAIRAFGFAGNNNNEADAYLLWHLLQEGYGCRAQDTDLHRAIRMAVIAGIEWPEVAL